MKMIKRALALILALSLALISGIFWLSNMKKYIRTVLTEGEFNTALDKIALISPNATISIIRDFVVAEKRSVHIEDHVCGIAKCSNPNCITNMGEPIQTEFVVISRDPVSLRCAYCDRTLVNISDNLL